jgi:hypothetical protein
MPGGTLWGQAQLRIFDRKFLPALKITKLVFFFFLLIGYEVVPRGQSHIILQQLSCGTRSKVSFVSNPAQISLKHSSQLTYKTTLATSFVFIRHVFHCVLH